MEHVNELLKMVNNEADDKFYREAAGKIFANMLDKAGEDKKQGLKDRQQEIEKAFSDNMVKMVNGEM
jgi:hypothetical protein